MSKIEKPNAQYEFSYPNWKVTRALIKGEKALKDTDKDAPGTFILIPNPEDTSTENKLRYEQYVDRASLFNFTKRTEAGMVGMVMTKPAAIELDASLDYFAEDVDGSGCGIAQQSNEVLSDVLEVGNIGLLADYPKTTAPTTEADMEANGIRAAIVLYPAESILDWRMTRKNTKQVLSYVKLRETVEEVAADDITESSVRIQFRILFLNAAGQYEQAVYDKEDKLIESGIIPVDGKGIPFDYIPFFFVGSVNNRPGIDPAPLQEIADLNIKHYRNSADWEESAFMVGQPSPVFSGLTEGWIKDVWKGGVKLGSRGGIPLPQGASAQLLQASPNGMPIEGMKHKEEQAIALGARLITAGSAQETAEATFIKHATDASVLKIVVMNINQGYKSALAACAQFMNSTKESVFALNTEFVSDRLTGDMVTALVASWQQGVISRDVLQAKLVKGGVIPDDIDLDGMNSDRDEEMGGVDLGDA